MPDILYYVKICNAGFTDDDDYRIFVGQVYRTVRRCGGCLYAFCLLPAHCHVLLEVAHGEIQQVVEAIHRVAAMRAKTVFRFSDTCRRIYYGLVEKNFYAARVSCFIHALPVLTGMVTDPAAYRWSSYRAYTGSHTGVATVNHDDIKAQVTRRHIRSGAAYRDYYTWFMENCFENYAAMLDERGQCRIGSKLFLRSVTPDQHTAPQHTVSGGITLDSIHFIVEQYIDQQPALKRLMKIYLGRTHTVLTNKQIGIGFGNLSVSRVSQLFRQAGERINTDPSFAESVAKLEQELNRR